MPKVITVTFILEDPLVDKLYEQKKLHGTPFSFSVKKAVSKYYGGIVSE